MDSFSNDSNERRGTSRKRRSLALIAREAPIAQREPGRQLLKGAVDGQDPAVAVMVVPCLTVGEGVQLLADCGEGDVVEEEPRGGVLQLLLARLAGQVVIAVRLRALLCALRTCRIAGVTSPYTFAPICTSLTAAAIANSAW